MMNVGFLVASYLFDIIRSSKTGLGEHRHLNLFGTEVSTYRTLFLVSLLLELALLPLIYFLRKGAEATDEGLSLTPEIPKYPQENLWNAFRLTVRDSINDTIRLFA